MPPPSSDRPKLILQESMNVVLFIGLLAYIAIAVAFAVYFLTHAYLYQVGDFEKAAIGALIAVVGTGLTAMAAIYTANRQALAAHQVEILRGETSRELADLTAKLTAELEVIKSHSARSLERLKTYLDAEKNGGLNRSVQHHLI
jgi:NADPH-dependent glutamate synthase beta subunit-like oxidoreductase